MKMNKTMNDTLFDIKLFLIGIRNYIVNNIQYFYFSLMSEKQKENTYIKYLNRLELLKIQYKYIDSTGDTVSAMDFDSKYIIPLVIKIINLKKVMKNEKKV